MPVWAILAAAITLEVLGTTCLQLSAQFTRPLYVLGMAICYGVSFYLLSVVLKTMPVGVAYAVWSGLGVVLITLMGLVAFGQRLDLPAVFGIGMIVAGVTIINLWSSATAH